MSQHEEMTKIVAAHMPVSFFGRGGEGKVSSSCACGIETTGHNKTMEQIHAEHIVLELEKAGFVWEEKAETRPRTGDRVIINSPLSRFHSYKGSVTKAYPASQEVVPYRILLDDFPDSPIPFFEKEVEVVPLEVAPLQFRTGERVKIQSEGSRYHNWLGTIVQVSEDPLPLRVQFDQGRDTIPFSKLEVVPAPAEERKFKTGDPVRIENGNSELHRWVGLVVGPGPASLKSNGPTYEVLMAQHNFVTVEYEKNLRPV